MKSPVTYYLLTLLLLINVSVKAADATDDITAYIKTGNAKEIARYFASTVELTIISDENAYPKAQAEAVLRDFFAKHAPQSVKPVHKLSSNPNIKFTVIKVHTNNGDFRVSFSMKNAEGTFMLTELRIEADKG